MFMFLIPKFTDKQKLIELKADTQLDRYPIIVKDFILDRNKTKIKKGKKFCYML